MKKHFYFLLAAVCFSLPVQAQIINTIAGDSTQGYCCDGSPAVNAELYYPSDVALDGYGNIYIADDLNNRIRKINTSGIITTIAGTEHRGYNGDGMAATLAELYNPSALILDDHGNIYICDDGNFRIRVINNSGIISTITGTGTSGYNRDNIAATLAQITASTGIAVDGSGNVYIGDIDNNRIRKISPAGIITTVAGTGAIGYSGDGGQATAAELYNPTGVGIDGSGNIYFGEHGNNCVRKISTEGIISTFAGTGVAGYSGDGFAATTAKLNWPNDIKFDGKSNIYIADVNNNCIRVVNTYGTITTIAGNGTFGFSGDRNDAILAEFRWAGGIAIDNSNSIYIADFGNNRIRYIRNTVEVNKLEMNENDINIYPNPNTGLFIVNFLSSINVEVQMIITNETGGILKEINTNTNQPTQITIDAPPGIYFLTATTANGKWSRKIIIE